MDPITPASAKETSQTLLSQSGRPSLAVAKTGLLFFMATLTIVFLMLISSYLVGQNRVSWVALPQLNILWLNTFWLVLSSLMLEWARRAAQKQELLSSSSESVALVALQQIRMGLLASGAFALFFLIGQGVAWQELNRSGFFLGANQSSSFFFLLTGLHGLHLLGGLVAWGGTTLKILVEKDFVSLGRIGLCALYWHYLLLVWLAMFGLILFAK